MITLIVIANGRMSVSDLHYRHVIEILASSFSCIEALVNDAPHPAVLDAGYLLVDTDSKIMVNRQDAFSLHQLPRKVLEKLKQEGLYIMND